MLEASLLFLPLQPSPGTPMSVEMDSTAVACALLGISISNVKTPLVRTDAMLPPLVWIADKLIRLEYSIPWQLILLLRYWSFSMVAGLGALMTLKRMPAAVATRQIHLLLACIWNPALSLRLFSFVLLFLPLKRFFTAIWRKQIVFSVALAKAWPLLGSLVEASHMSLKKKPTTRNHRSLKVSEFHIPSSHLWQERPQGNLGIVRHLWVSKMFAEKAPPF